jgi:Fic family protein
MQYLLGKCDAMVEAIKNTPLQPEYRTQLLRVSLVKGAQATTAIEGNTLTELEVERVADGQSLAQSKQYQEQEVRNILDAMNKILKDVAIGGRGHLITPDLILEFHRDVGRELGERFDAIPGRFRTDSRVVGPYRCPQPEHVQELMTQFCEWLPREFGFATNRQTFAQAVVQAIVSHVYLEWIHPFGDGNGRTGRLLEFYILLRAGNPDIASHILSNLYNDTRPEYYRQLNEASKTRDLTAFLQYAVQGYHDGLKAVMSAIANNSLMVAWRHLVYARFADRQHLKTTVHKRRRDLALAIQPRQDGLTVGELMMLTPELARDYAALTERTLLRDLRELIEMQIVTMTGGKYALNFGLLMPHMASHRRPHTHEQLAAL